jgi:hypothetical protein
MKRRGGDEEVGHDDRCGDIRADDGDLLRRNRAQRADSRTGDADPVAARERMRMHHRLGDENRRQKQEDRDSEQAHREQANTQFCGDRSNSEEACASF